MQTKTRKGGDTMAKKSYVRDFSGKITHVRVTSDDGRTSYLYKANEGLDVPIHGIKGSCIEVADQKKDGTTTAYKADNSITGIFLYGGRGRRK